MLKLSKKGGYALKAVLYIAENNDKLFKIIDLSSALDISESLLRRIISDLDRGGILLTVKGRAGGVKLGKELKYISVYDILNCVGEELGVTDCTKGLTCEKIDTCVTTNLLGNLQKSFNGILKLQTLDKIIKIPLNKSL